MASVDLEDIDWWSEKNEVIASSSSHPIFNCKDMKSHLLIQSSGSSGPPKWVALGKKAFLEHAKSVNRFLKTTREDHWYCPLPLIHVGGLAIAARSFQGGYSWEKTQQKHWNCDSFLKEVAKATLTSLVPTQVFDLVKNKKRAPENLRVAVVGGGQLSEVLYKEARALGWPILPSYGMTEAGSQVATASLESLISLDFPDLEFMDHIEYRVSEEGVLEIKSPFLFTGYFLENEGEVSFNDPKTNGWFTTSDSVEWGKRGIRKVYRRGQAAKVKGVLVHLAELKKQWQRFTAGKEDCEFLFVPDSRDENRIVMVFELGRDVLLQKSMAEKFCQQSESFKRPREVYYVEKIPRSAVGKVREGELKKQLGF